jgi:hypothetical protein
VSFVFLFLQASTRSCALKALLMRYQATVKALLRPRRYMTAIKGPDCTLLRGLTRRFIMSCARSIKKKKAKNNGLIDLKGFDLEFYEYCDHPVYASRYFLVSAPSRYLLVYAPSLLVYAPSRYSSMRPLVHAALRVL